MFSKSKKILRLLCDANFPWFAHRIRRKLFPAKTISPEMSHRAFEAFKPMRHAAKKSSGADPVLKVLFFSHDLKKEGAQISLFEIAATLKKSGLINPTVIAFEDGPLREWYETAGIPVEVVPVEVDEITTISRLDKTTFLLARRMDSLEPDLIFANTARTFPAILAAHQSKIPSIWNIREGVSPEKYFNFLPDTVACWASGCALIASKVVFVSHASRKEWRSYEAAGNFEVIHNGLNPARFPKDEDFAARQKTRIHLGVRSDSIVCLSVGTLEARKGQKDLVHAFEILAPEVQSRVELVFLGAQDSAYGNELMKYCEKPSLKGRVHFVKPLDRINLIYAAADVFVLSSRSESFPRVILEAMAAGLPVITTPVDGIVEQVQEEVNAYFYKPFDFQNLSLKIQKIVTEPDSMRRMGDQSRQLLNELTSFDAMLDSYHSLARSFFQ